MKVDIQGLERDPMLRGRVGRLVGAALETIKAAPIRARVTFFDDDGPKGGLALRCAVDLRVPYSAGLLAAQALLDATWTPTVSPFRNSTVILSASCTTWAAVMILPSAEIKTPEPRPATPVNWPGSVPAISRSVVRMVTTEGLARWNTWPTVCARAVEGSRAARRRTAPVSPALGMRRR